MKIAEIANAIGGDLHGNATVEIVGVAPLGEAGEGTIAYLSDKRHAGKIDESGASAFVLPQGVSCDRPFISSDNPAITFAKVVNLFHPQPERRGIDERAVVEESARLGRDVTLYPLAYVGEGAVLGDRVTVYPGAFIGPGCAIGDDTTIHANVVVCNGTTIGKRVIIHGGTVVGSDGYGFAWDGEKHFKIPQVGVVVIGDDVEIGANCSIDRAALSRTEIKSGAKIDNLVHIAHNCVIGEHTLLAAQVGFAGSVTVGSGVAMAGQVGVSGHLKVGDGVMVGGKAGITKDIEAGAKISGYPAIPHMQWMRQQKMIEKLPELKEALKTLEEKIEKLEKMENSDD